MKLMNIMPGNLSPGQEKEKEEKSKSADIMNINYTGILTWWGFNQSSHLCDIFTLKPQAMVGSILLIPTLRNSCK